MKVDVKYIERTPLDKEAYVRLVRHYVDSKRDILIVFDGRYVDCGAYRLNLTKDRHEIRIGIKSSQYVSTACRKKVSHEAAIYNYICTTLHEIKHLIQSEHSGSVFIKDDFGINPEIKEPVLAIEYSKCELEAREFECRNLLQAVEFYDKVLEQTNFERKPDGR